MTDKEFNQTAAVRSGQVRGIESEHAEPIYTTSSYVYSNAAEAAAVFAGEREGNVYSRYTNPTVRTFEHRMAQLDGAEDAVATSSGMSAIMSVCLALLKAGDHVVCSKSVFGTTTGLMNNYLAKLGIEITFVSLVDLQEWQNAIKTTTRMLFLESPSNPLCEVADINKLAQIAHSSGALVVVDNTYCTPALQQPLALGADIAVYSATKYIDGQGRCIGGVATGRRNEMAEVRNFLRTAGPTLSPFNAWVFLKGLETLNLRMKAHSESALELAQWLQTQPEIEHVYYIGLDEHPQREIAQKQQSNFGGVLSFEIKGDKSMAWQFIDSTEVFSLTANLGDAKSTIVHPATTTHGKLSPAQRQDAGIKDNLIRISAGLEAIEDLKTDLKRGLAKVS